MADDDGNDNAYWRGMHDDFMRRLVGSRPEHNFRREVLGEWKEPERPVFRWPRSDHRADAAIYMHRYLQRLTNRVTEAMLIPRQAGERFMLVSPALAGELEPDAMVTFDRDLEPVIANPVFITRWGHLYLASLHSHHVVWCWNGEKWDDISGGYWAEPHERAWMDCLKRARALLEAVC